MMPVREYQRYMKSQKWHKGAAKAQRSGGGAREVARRRSQIERGIIKVSR